MGAISDAVHGFIPFDEEGPEKAVIDSAPFQRIRGIRQLEFASLVFPTATHTRFTHSLGVMHVAGEICRNLGFDEERTSQIRLAALVHDIGHAPFAHLFERLSKRIHVEADPFDHERLTKEILEGDEGLQDALGPNLDPVVKILSKDANRPAIDFNVISSTMDADQMDYILRDSLFCGLTGVTYDLPRLLSSIDNHEDRRLVVTKKGIPAADGFRVARFQLHRTVHHHHAAHAAEEMLRQAVEISDGAGDGIGELFRHPPDEETRAQLLSLHDGNFLGDLKSRMEDEDAIQLVDRLQRRELYKRAITFSPGELQDTEIRFDLFQEEDAWKHLARRIVETSDVAPRKVIVKELNVDTKQYSSSLVPAKEPPIYLKMDDGRVEDLSESGFPVTRPPKEGARKVVHVLSDPDVRGQVEKATREILNYPADG